MSSECTLLMLAGYSASGKTTLLSQCLKNKSPLFGLEFNEAFQKTTLPPRIPELKTEFEETLSCGTWFSGIHLRKLQSLSKLPELAVVHVDLTSALWDARGSPFLSEASLSLFPRKIRSLLSVEDNEKIFFDYFSAPIFGRFKNIIINTLVVDWGVIVKNYESRKKLGLQTSALRDKFFVESGPGENFMKSANKAWLNSVKQTKGKCLITTRDGNKLIVRLGSN